jgi:murein DD-endopeptidase MepM/ murein hydrolase activator NlpD
LLNARDGVARLMARFRPAKPERSATATRLHRGAVRLTRRVVDLATGHPTITAPRSVALSRHEPRRVAPASRRRSLVRRHLVIRLANERTVPLAVALVVLVAGVLSVGPIVVSPVGAAQPESQPVRLAIGGGVAPADPELGLYGDLAAIDAAGVVDDGTIYKPVAVDTTVESGSSLLRHYAVKSGDTLTGIASRFGVSMMTIWWANHLDSKDQLHVGQNLVIPPVNGLIVTVEAGDTLDSLAARYKVNPDDVLAANELTDPVLIVGQVLVMPGAKGDPIPTPKPKPAVSRVTRVLPYVGGAWAWPVVGGGNYISQYYSSYHPAIDIAAKYGTPEVAARAGRVVWAGWKSGGGAYQVWIDHGNGIYTNEMHMSAVLVSVGQYVAKGQQIGRVGMTGNATGPHCHFEVWIGYPWRSGSYRVNPLRYY